MTENKGILKSPVGWCPVTTNVSCEYIYVQKKSSIIFIYAQIFQSY